MVMVLLLIVLSPFILLAIAGITGAIKDRKDHAQFVAMLKRAGELK
jgi:hypothetical protein